MSDPWDDLTAALSSFNVEEVKRRSSSLLDEDQWSEVRRRVENYREVVTPALLSKTIVAILKKTGLDTEAVAKAAERLSLIACSLSEKKTWFAYQLTAPSRTHLCEDDDLDEIISAIERSTGQRTTVIRHDSDSLLLSVGEARGAIIACLRKERILFRSPPPNPKKLQPLLKGLGYEKARYLHLSGRHVQSLLRALSRKRSASHLATTAPETGPRRLRSGLDFTAARPTKDDLDRRLGKEEDAPRLPRLTIRAKVDTSEGCQINSQAVLRSSNVEQSLRGMAAMKIISSKSLFLSMLTEHCKSDLKVKITL